MAFDDDERTGHEMDAHESAPAIRHAPEGPARAGVAGLRPLARGPNGTVGGRMRVLVMPHGLAIGGSQINAIDLAAGVAKAGHEVSVFGVRGPLVDMIRERGLEFIDAHGLSWRPAPTRIAQLVALARRKRIDVIHAYEWSTCLDAYFRAAPLPWRAAGVHRPQHEHDSHGAAERAASDGYRSAG